MTLIGLGVFGCILRRYKRPATDNSMNKYSASTPILNNTNVSWNNKQTRVAALINITETIGVKNLILINANIVGMWLFLAAPNIIRLVDNKILFTKPNVDKATNIEIIHACFPINFSANVTATAFDANISFGVSKVRFKIKNKNFLV